LCVPCIVLLVLFYLRLQSHDASDKSRHDAARAAQAAATKVLAYDYRQIDSDVATAKTFLTTPLSADYANSSAELRTAAVALKSIQQAEVKTAAVEDASKNRVVVLVFVDQTLTQQPPGQSKPQAILKEERIRMTMLHRHGHWLVSQLKIVI
jgi:Mce-associated membrane protein